MKIIVPEKAVNVCDFCSKTGYLKDCWVCTRQYCLIDEGIIAASYGFTDICKECARDDRVRAICDDYAGRLQPVYQARDEKLKELGKLRNAPLSASEEA